jgi:hypothetical protein
MKLPSVIKCLFNNVIWAALFSAMVGNVAFADNVLPTYLAEPPQKEKFFEPERFTFTDSAATTRPVIEPHLAVSHDTREDEVGIGVKQTSERFHGEAGGKLNLLGDISLTTFAKVPVYTKETVATQSNSDGGDFSEIMKDTSRFSWRSELGIPVQKGVDLNFFYDNSTFGRVSKPGVEEREEKFGTRFIFQFK